MKKLLILTCLAVAVLSMSACKKESEKPLENPQTSSTQSTLQSEPTGTTTTMTTTTTSTTTTSIPEKPTEVQKIKITFDVYSPGTNKKIELAPISVEKGKPIGKLPNPSTKDVGYKFRFWEGKEGKVIKSNDVLYEDTKLFAMWMEDENYITIYFNSDGDDIVPNMKVKKNEPFGQLPVPHKEGATFMAWTDRHGMPWYPDSKYTEDLELFATWQ